MGNKMNYAELIRSEFGKGDAIRDAGLTTPEDVVRFDDIPYGQDPVWQILDIYRPKEAGEKLLPVIVNVHGGGMVYGTKETYQFYCMSLAQQGFAVVNYTYRLCPENKFPAQLEDCCRVFSWVLEHASDYHLDTSHVFAVGDSAGGTILGQFCNLCTNPDYAASLPSCNAPENFIPTAVALNCGDYIYHAQPDSQATEEQAPETDALFTGAESVDTAEALEEGVEVGSLLPFIFKQGGTAEEVRLGSVIPNIIHGFPPACLMSCQEDFLKDQLVEITAAFVKNNVPFMSQFFVDESTPLQHVFHCNMKSEVARFCNREQIRYFRLFLER